jgi:hypothetical protein
VRPSFAYTVVPDITAVGITGGVVIGINDEQKSAPLWQAAVAEPNYEEGAKASTIHMRLASVRLIWVTT